MQEVVVLGSTGSIGESTLDVISRHPQDYRVFALSCRRNVEKVVQQAHQFKPRFVVVVDEVAAGEVRQALAGPCPDVQVLQGSEALNEVAADPRAGVVMAAIVGAVGLEPTLAAVEAGKRVLLANKESLVMAGGLFMQAVRDHGATLLPIDSEHNAIFQCMPVEPGRNGVARILLTASGGPFRLSTLEELRQVTPAQACKHPNWSMGRKISVDSSTLMNKGLELIEACHLFATPADEVDVVIHPQSIIHSMVQYIDGSVLAQLGNPDMRTPIAYGLAWPDRIDAGVSPLNIIATARLDFSAPDVVRFPCLRLAREAFEQGGTASAVLNAANEVAVDAFLDQRIGFLAIPEIIERVLSSTDFFEPVDIASVKAADSEARRAASRLVQDISH